MKVYVASHDRWNAHAAAGRLIDAKIDVTSRWHTKEFLPSSDHTESERADIATEDYDDITIADALVLLSGPDKYSGGKFVEAGIAIGQNKPVFVIGRRENMLMWLPIIKAFETIDDFIAFAKAN